MYPIATQSTTASAAILKALRGRKRGVTAADIAAKTGLNLNTVRTTLTLLAKDGFVITAGNVQTGLRGRPANLYLSA